MLPQDERAESTINAQPDKVTPRHRALMRRIVSGMTLTEACTDLGFTVSRASIIVNSPLFQAELKLMEVEIGREFAEAEALKSGDATRTVLSDASVKAARTIAGALDSDNAGVQMTAAKDILDRTGYAKEDKIKAQVLVQPSQALIDVLSRITTEKSVGKPTDVKAD